MRSARVGMLLAIVLACGVTTIGLTPPAQADCGLANPFMLEFGRHPVLRANLHAKLVRDACEIQDYTFVAQGYFKVHGVTVARLPKFPGHTTASPQSLTLKVSRRARHRIRAAARRTGSRRVVLTMVFHTTQAGEPRAVSQDAFLRIPR